MPVKLALDFPIILEIPRNSLAGLKEHINSIDINGRILYEVYSFVSRISEPFLAPETYTARDRPFASNL